MSVVQCEYCGAIFRDEGRWTGEDYLSDHLTDDHQDRLPNTQVLEGAL